MSVLGIRLAGANLFGSTSKSRSICRMDVFLVAKLDTDLDD